MENRARMRVVMVSKALVIGAYQRKLEDLASQPGVELAAIVPAYWREGRKRFQLDRAYTAGYELIVAPLALNGQFHLHFYPTLGRLLSQLRPDVLHMDEEPYNLATWHALKLGQAAGARCLFFTWQNLPRRYPWPFRAFEAANYRRAAHAIAGNPTATDVLRAKGYGGPVTVIPQFGVDPAIFSPRTPAARNNPAMSDGATTSDRSPRTSPFVIGYSGRLVPEKGVDVLMRACASLLGIDWTLHLLGDGPEREHLSTLAAQLGIAGRVRFLGHLPSTQTPAVYPTFDALVLPSLSQPHWVEQFGRVLIEAMACGVPVVGSSSGEIPWVIGDAGLVFPEGNATALGTILAELASDPAQHAALAARGRARVLAQFTQSQVAAATAQVYREIMQAE
jgi:glycosyltransferase involved in cell wall biosynthesis